MPQSGRIRGKHGCKSFDVFIDNLLNPTFEWHCPPLGASPIAQCFDQSGRCRVDIFVTNERLDEAVDAMAATFKLLPRHDAKQRANASASGFPNQLADELHQSLLLRYAPLMSLFGYTEEGARLGNSLLRSSGSFSLLMGSGSTFD